MEQEYTRCQECGDELPKSRTRTGWLCRTIGLCKYCYQHKFDQREESDRPAISQNGEKLLSWSERREMERAGFDSTNWSPEFYQEWLEIWDD